MLPSLGIQLKATNFGVDICGSKMIFSSHLEQICREQAWAYWLGAGKAKENITSTKKKKKKFK